jgi:hypothetical protein
MVFYSVCGFKRCSYICVFEQPCDDSSFFSNVCESGPFLFIFCWVVLFHVVRFMFSLVSVCRVLVVSYVVLFLCVDICGSYFSL